jgi:hypothetical protein
MKAHSVFKRQAIFLPHVLQAAFKLICHISEDD